MKPLTCLPLALVTFLALLLGASGFQSRPPGDSTHAVAGNGFLVLCLLLLPVCAILPLVPAWKSIRRKRMAAFGMSVLTLTAGALVFFDSFTGHLIASLRGDASHPSRDALLRFKALHAVGAPLLLSLCLLGLWILTIRLAGRTGRS